MMRRRVLARLAASIAVAGVTLAQAQALSAPAVPDAIRAPAGAQLVLKAHATGAQLYVCTAGADGQWRWTLEAPDAQLRDARGALIGHHGAGPSWKHRDGSEVTGKAVAHVDAPDPHAIPWLLVSVVGRSGEGALAHVTDIQRLHTRGGLPPPAAQCDAAHQQARVRSPYSADYYFFAGPG